MSKGKDISAFPYAIGNKGAFGMTLRDYFAAKAVAGMLANQENDGLEWSSIAKSCYQIADAMLEARNK